MIEFSFTEEQTMLREMVRDFATNELKPIASKIDEEEAIPDEIIRKIAELGLLGAPFPIEYGGSGIGEIGYCIIQEEIARACLSTATFIGAHVSIGTNAIFIGGTEEQKQKWLPPLTAGEKIAAFALTEPSAGSDAFNLKTKAYLDGDEWVINGEKLWITNGPFADVFSVFARTNLGISLFVVEKGTPGFTPGAPEKKMGIRGSKTSSLTFDNVRIPKENLIGRDGKGFLIAMKTLDAGRLGLGAACLGACKELLEISTRFAKERKQFDEPIANFQAVQFMLAEMATLIYETESIVYRTAMLYDKQEILPRHSAIVKLVSSNALDRCVDYAMQIHGGMGYSRELPIERFYRDSRINRIFEGTSEIQKLIIAKDVIKRNGVV
jgi:alkylation response protein AidB-like acyl-CoA dehydrogenase